MKPEDLDLTRSQNAAYPRFALIGKLHTDPLAEIRGIKPVSGQMALEFEPQPVEAMSQVEAFLKNDSRPWVTLSEVTDHFSSPPFGWPVFETLLLVARLVVSERIEIFEQDVVTARPEDALDRMVDPKRRGNLRVRPAAALEGDLAEALREITAEIFDGTPPEDAASLDRFIRSGFRRWRRNLDRFSRRVRSGTYPGAEDIAAVSAMVNAFLAMAQPELFQAVNNRRDEIRQRFGDYGNLVDFFQRRIGLWHRLLEAMERCNDKRDALMVDSRCQEALAALDRICHDPRPYKALGEIPRLVEQVSAVYEQLAEKELDRKRRHVSDEIVSRLDRLQAACDAAGADPVLRNQVLSGLHEIRRELGKETSPKRLQQLRNMALDRYDLALDRVNFRL
jgi:hypothetical protein